MVTIALHRGTEKIFMKFKGHTLLAFLRQTRRLGWSNKSKNVSSVGKSEMQGH